MLGGGPGTSDDVFLANMDQLVAGPSPSSYPAVTMDCPQVDHYTTNRKILEVETDSQQWQQQEQHPLGQDKALDLTPPEEETVPRQQ